MSITSITPYASITTSGWVNSQSGAAQNIPAGALIVSVCHVVNGSTGVAVSDTAGNTYTVLQWVSANSGMDAYLAYCTNAIANTANTVTWTCPSANISGVEGAAYATSAGTWAVDGTPQGFAEPYGTAFSSTITTTGAGVIAIGVNDYYGVSATFAFTGVTQQAYVDGSSSYSPGAYADTITTAAQTSLPISVTESTSGRLNGYAAAFTVSGGGGGSNALTGTGAQSGAASGTLTVAVPLTSASVQAQGAHGALTVTVPLTGHASATQNADGSLTISVPLSGQAIQQAAAQAAAGVGVPLSGAATQSQQSSAALSIHLGLSGVALQQAMAAGSLTNTPAGAIALTGGSAEQQAASGSLSVRNNLSGASLQIAGAQGSLAIDVPLSASSVSASRANGSLTVGISLSGAGLQAAIAQAALSVTGGGASAVQQSGSGLLTLKINLTAASVQQVSAVAALGNSTITTYIANGRYYAAAPIRSFYGPAPQRSLYAAAPIRSFYATP